MRLACCVKHTRDIIFNKMNNEIGEIAYVDDLRKCVGAVWGEDTVAACDANRLIGESFGWVVRANDQPGPDDDRVDSKNFLNNFLA